MNCPNCGAPAAGPGFCGRCGARVEANQQAQPGTINLDMDGEGAGRGYSYRIEHQPAFSLAVLSLQAEQSIMAEAGAMVSMSANVELQSQMKGGLLGALKRAAGGESAFVSTFTARGGPGEVTLDLSSVVKACSCCSCRDRGCCSCHHSEPFTARCYNRVSVTSLTLVTSLRGKARRNTLCAKPRPVSFAVWSAAKALSPNSWGPARF